MEIDERTTGVRAAPPPSSLAGHHKVIFDEEPKNCPPKFNHRTGVRWTSAGVAEAGRLHQAPRPEARIVFVFRPAGSAGRGIAFGLAQKFPDAEQVLLTTAKVDQMLRGSQIFKKGLK